MKKIFLIFLLLLIELCTNAQLARHKYLVKFTDKNHSPYTISNPSQFLTAKAIARRTAQGISIKYNDLPVSPAYIDSIVNTGVTLFCKSKWFNSATIYTTDSSAFNRIKAFPFILGIDTIANADSATKKKTNATNSLIDKNLNLSPINLTCFSYEYPANYNNFGDRVSSYNYGTTYNQVHMISCDYLHNLGYCGQGMTIAQIDAGYWYVDTISAFDSLWSNNQILGTKDFVDPSSNIFREYAHGMEVLSTMGGNKPNVMIGTSPKADFWLLRSENVNTEYIIEEYNWASAAEFADSAGADIITTSLGYNTFDASWMNHTYADMNGHTCPASIAATTAASKGMIVCASAGNEGSSAWHYIGTPADADSILTVGAVDASGIYASFSSTGPSYDKRIKPNVATQGEGTYVISSGGNPIPGNGTSFACPLLAGATACLWQAFPNMTNIQIMDAIMQSASQYTHPDSLLGYGIPNFAAAYTSLAGVAIHDIDNENTINIFPNPFSDVINIMFYSNDTDFTNIDIYDIEGKKVLSETGIHRRTGYSNFTVDKVSSLSKGVYIIKVSSNNNIFTKRLIKIS